jgi:hypothetical protein
MDTSNNRFITNWFSHMDCASGDWAQSISIPRLWVSYLFGIISRRKGAIVELLAIYGIKERFQANSDAVLRSIMWDGTIINLPSPEVMQKLNSPAASIGLVAVDPIASAYSAADFLRSKGFTADVILDVEPEIQIAFVSTNAMMGTILNFRKHMIHLPKPK